MLRIEFDVPVCIYFGKPGRSRTVSSVFEAAYCLKSEKWPARNAPLSLIATAALDGAQIGQITAAEAREAFVNAAWEARILVEDQSHPRPAPTAAFASDAG
ncbi:DUF982 domain-containing protein [Mesorhizobium sp. M0306]|uniref:DUF982 domain-containing protein n=1 Tax=unclassified Mesorhizobium TaxID=325217 RepID=UPI00333D6185